MIKSMLHAIAETRGFLEHLFLTDHQDYGERVTWMEIIVVGGIVVERYGAHRKQSNGK